MLDIFDCDVKRSSLFAGASDSSGGFLRFLIGPMLGRLSDSFGRKPLLLYSLVGSGVGLAWGFPPARSAPRPCPLPVATRTQWGLSCICSLQVQRQRSVPTTSQGFYAEMPGVTGVVLSQSARGSTQCTVSVVMAGVAEVSERAGVGPKTLRNYFGLQGAATGAAIILGRCG